MSTITSKGQVTIPVERRRAVGFDVGVRVEFVVERLQHIEVMPRQGDFRALRGSVPVPETPVEVDDMDTVTGEGWASNRSERCTAWQKMHDDEVVPRDGTTSATRLRHQ